jgi:hypothetical protein
MTTGIFCFYSQNRLIQTSQTGGQQYSDTSPLIFPAPSIIHYLLDMSENILPGKNALAYFAGASVTKKKCFVSLAPTTYFFVSWADVIKKFTAVIYETAK